MIEYKNDYNCTMVCEICGHETDVEAINTRIINYSILQKNCWCVCNDCAIDLEDKVLHFWYN